MNVLNPTELEFAAALAKLTPAHPTPEQRELAQQLLLAFNQKAMALDALSKKYVDASCRLSALQIATAEAVAASLREKIAAVQASGLQLARNREAKKVFDTAKGQQP